MNIEAKVNNLGSWLDVTNSYIYMGYGSNRIGVSGNSVSLYGSVYISSNVSIGIYDVTRKRLGSLDDNDYVWAVG